MRLNEFLNDEAGAVTVDWVVLTAAIVGLGLAVMAVVSGGVENLSGDVAGELAEVEPGDNFFAGLAASAGIDWSAYSPVAGTHGTDTWGYDSEGQTWAENTYSGWSELDDATITSMYNEQYAIAMTGNTGSEFHRQRADYVTVTEQIMTDRGMAVPEGNVSAEDIRAMYN